MKMTRLLCLVVTLICSTFPAVLAAHAGIARKELRHLLPSSTRYVQATAVTEGNQPEATGLLSLHRLQARQNANSTTVKPAVIVTAGYTLQSFPPYVCGSIDGDPDLPFTCSGYATCAGVSSSLCCMTSGVCPVSASFTACQNVQITDYDDANYGSASFAISSRLYCDLYQGVQCHTNAVGSLAETVCHYTSLRASQTIYPPQQFLSYFAGYTIEWNTWWTLLAVKGGSSTSSSTTSNTTSASSSAKPTDAVGYLDDFRGGAPSCVNNISTLCPILYTDIQTCQNGLEDGNCYCNAFASRSCAGICLDNKESNDYLNYVVPTCQDLFEKDSSSYQWLFNGSDPANWTSLWPDYTNVSDTAYIQLFPWAWDVRLNATELANGTANRTNNDASQQLEQCPSVQSALVSFAIVNAVVFGVSIMTANRETTYFLTCHLCGGPHGGKWWPASALLSVAINLLGNVVNALLIKGTPGYHHVPLIPLILLWCTRPRLAWLVILLVWVTRKLGKGETQYLDSAVAALMAEVILQATGALYMGISINHARVNQFYLLGHVKYTPHGSDALIMYSGALLWTASIGLAFLRAIYTFTPIGGIIRGAFVAAGRHLKKWSTFTCKYIKMGSVYLAVYLWAGIRGISITLFMLSYWCIYSPAKTYMLKHEWPLCEKALRGRKANFVRWFRITLPEEYAKPANVRTGDQEPRNAETHQRTGSRGTTTTTGTATTTTTHGLQPPNHGRQISHSWSTYTGISYYSQASSQYLMGRPDYDNSRESLPGTPQQHGDSTTDIRRSVQPRPKKKPKPPHNFEEYIKAMGLRPKILKELKWLVLCLLLPWMGQWIFWVGFVRMAQDLYCPPEIWSMTVVWSVCSVVAIWCGAAL